MAGMNSSDDKPSQHDEVCIEDIFEAISTGIIVLNRQGRVVHVNHCVCEILGLTKAQIQERSPIDRRWNAVSEDGTPLKDDEHPSMITLKTGRPVKNFVMGIAQPALDGHRWVLTSSEPVYCKVTGEIKQVVVTFNDITEQKRTEELLQRSEKLNVAGKLAAAVAHEIRNPLTSLRGFIQLLQPEIEEKHFVEIMLNELDRIHLIVNEFLLLAKPQQAQYERKDVGTILAHVLSLMKAEALMNNIQITMEIEPDIPLVPCEENQLKQVFINLLKNAMEATPQGGKVTVQIKRADELRIIVQITDHGPGVPKELIPKIGEPFFTTKKGGTGLGLTVSNKIISNHQGTILIQSEPDSGTTVLVYLPILPLQPHPKK